MITVSNADRIIFPELGRTKGDVVAYYERIAPKLLPHVVDRPLSIRRYPKGLSGPGFFQKNVPPHFPASIGRLEIPRSREASKKHKRTPEQEVTIYPVVSEEEHLAYLANQQAIELHVPTARASDLFHPDRVVIDLDPPSDSFAKARSAAQLVRAAIEPLGLLTVPVATGSKGYHLVAAIAPVIDAETLATALQQLAALLAAQHPEQLTITFRVAQRGERVFVDWLRNRFQATVIAPYSLRAKPRASVAVPLSWDELATTDPDAFTIDDVELLLDRPDSLAELAKNPLDARPFVAAVGAEFERSGLELETFDRFRS